MNERADTVCHTHTVHRHQQHLNLDNSAPSAITIAPGEMVELKDKDSISVKLSPTSTVDAIRTLDFSLINQISGPAHVDGAVPGDALKVTSLGFEPSGWGWTATIPGFGLLAEDSPDPALNTWSYAKACTEPAAYGAHARVSLKPLCGTIALAPAAAGPHNQVPPHQGGGNMEIRDLTIGVELYLPVQVKEALCSIGDPHAAHGDGEVCGTGIGSPMSVSVKFDLVKNANPSFPRFVTPAPVTRHPDAKGYEVTTGIGPDLMEAARNSMRGMIDLPSKQEDMSAAHAYMLCSVCADLRISEIADRPNWVV